MEYRLILKDNRYHAIRESCDLKSIKISNKHDLHEQHADELWFIAEGHRTVPSLSINSPRKSVIERSHAGLCLASFHLHVHRGRPQACLAGVAMKKRMAHKPRYRS